MLICRVVGSAVSTVKDQQLGGLKLLVVREVTPQNRVVGRGFLAVDAVGAGDGEVVCVVTGSSARYAERLGNRYLPCDATIVGILDSIDVDGENSYRAGNN